MADKIVEEDLNEIVKNLEEFRDKINGNTFLVTGGAGFIGSWICDVLNKFDAHVICVDNLTSGSTKNIGHLMNNENFTFVNSDVLNFDPDKAGKKIDYIIHAASLASPPHYMEHSIETLDTNILGTRKLLEFSVKNKIKGILITSTSEVYGNPSEENVPTSENYYGFVNSFGPRSMYDEGKRAAEAYCYSFFERVKKKGEVLPLRIARIFNTYGPKLDTALDSKYSRALTKLVVQALNGQPITVYNEGKQTRSFCYITDQIEGLFRLLLTPGIDGQVFNVGNDTEITINELAQKIIKIANSGSRIVSAESTYNIKDDPMRRCPDIRKARETLKFRPKVDLESGLIKTIPWIKSNLFSQVLP